MSVDAELHRMSADEYHRVIDAGGFDEDARIELIDGLLLDMSPKSPAHERVILVDEHAEGRPLHR